MSDSQIPQQDKNARVSDSHFGGNHFGGTASNITAPLRRSLVEKSKAKFHFGGTRQEGCQIPTFTNPVAHPPLKRKTFMPSSPAAGKKKKKSVVEEKNSILEEQQKTSSLGKEQPPKIFWREQPGFDIQDEHHDQPPKTTRTENIR